MAIVKAPALSLDASGNLGGVCYSSWRGIAIARAPWTGTVPNTGKQVTQQGYMTNVSKSWGNSLSTLQRASWNEAAKDYVWRDRLGSPYIPNGYQLYLKLNIRRLVMSLAKLNSPPSVQKWVDVAFIETVVNLGAGWISVLLRKEPLIYPTSYGIDYYRAGPYDSGGRNPIDGEWRFKSLKVPPNNWVDFGVVANKWYWYRARAISEFGDVQNWFQTQVQFA